MTSSSPRPPSPPSPPFPPHSGPPKGRWTFHDALGGYRCSSSAPCPICGGTGGGTWCQISAPDRVQTAIRAVLCRRRVDAGSGGRSGTRQVGGDGAPYMAAGSKQGGGRVWSPVDPQTGQGVEPTPMTPEEAAEAEAKVAAGDEAKRMLAEIEYRRACGGSVNSDVGVDHPTVRAYLMGRGIDPAWLPEGKIPRPIRYCEDFALFYDFERRPKGWKHPLERMITWPGPGRAGVVEPRTFAEIPAPSRAPAMVAAMIGLHDRPKIIRGAHATYLKTLDDGSVVKDEHARGKFVLYGGRREHGSCDGLVIIGGEGATPENMFPTGVAIVGEGFETTFSVMVGCGCKHSAIVASHTTGLKKLPKILSGTVWEKQIHTYVGAVDLDKLRNAAGDLARAGQLVWDVVEHGSFTFKGLRELQPWATLHRAIMRASDFPELVRRVELGGEDLSLARKGGGGREALGCAVECLDGVWWEDQPADPAKGTDWNNALVEVTRVNPEFRREIGRVALRGCDLDANKRRADEWLAGAGDVARASSEMTRTAAADVAGGIVGDDDAGSGDRGNVVYSPSDKARSRAPDAPDSDGADGPLDGGEGEGSGGGGDDGHNVLPDTDLACAHMFLWQTYARPEGKRAGTCYELKYVNEEFKRWAGNVWVPMRAKNPLITIRGEIRQWMTRKGRWVTPKQKKGQEAPEPYFQSVTPTIAAVEAVAKCVLDEVRVDTKDRQFWMMPDFNAVGEPIVGRRAWQRCIPKPAEHGLPSPDDLVALGNGLLDARAVERGTLVWRPPDPRFFNENALPFDLPVEKVRRAMASGLSGMDELAEEVCPDVVRFQYEVSGGDESPEEAREQAAELRKYFWYICTLDMDLKEANICFLHGPGNAGKGTELELMQGVVGEGNFVSTSVDEAADKNHITSWVSKRAAFVEEPEGGARTDWKRCWNLWKKVSGRGGVATRELFKLENPHTVLRTKICAAANEMPDFRDRTGQAMNRVIAFGFKEGHTGKKTYDRGLKDRLIAQAAGAFVWAIGGGMEIGRLRRLGGRVFNQPSRGNDALASLRDYQSEYGPFLEEWLELTASAEDCLKSVDLWEAFVRYRVLAHHEHPRSGGQGGLTKAILSLLQEAGWKGGIDVQRRYKDASTGTERRMATYTKLKLTHFAQMKVAEVEAARAKRDSYGVSADEQQRMWDKT